jgi:hypothetical protein
MVQKFLRAQARCAQCWGGSRDPKKFLGVSLHRFRHWLHRRPDDIKKHWILHPTFRAGPLRLALFLEIKVKNFRALFWARSLNRFFRRALPLLRLRILSNFQCCVRCAKFAMLQTSEPHAVKGAGSISSASDLQTGHVAIAIT